VVAIAKKSGRELQRKNRSKIGHNGVTRPYAAPDRQVEVTMDRCPDCGADLGTIDRVKKRLSSKDLMLRSTGGRETVSTLKRPMGSSKPI